MTIIEIAGRFNPEKVFKYEYDDNLVNKLFGFLDPKEVMLDFYNEEADFEDLKLYLMKNGIVDEELTVEMTIQIRKRLMYK